MPELRSVLRVAASGWAGSNGVARRMIVALILFSSAITAVITVMELYLDYRSDVRGIDERIESIRKAYLPTLTESVWVSERSRIQTQLDGLLNLADIEYVGIAVEGQIKWSAGRQRSARRIEATMPLVRAYRGREVNIGELRVVASVDNVLGRLWSRLVVVLVSNGVKTFLVAAFMLVMFQLLVGRHLEHLSAHLRRVGRDVPGAGELRLDRPASGHWRPDALDYVTAAVNDMQRSLRGSIAEIEQLNLTLEQRVRRRTEELALANRDLEAFSYSVAHDLKGPLRRISGFAAMLLEGHAGELGVEGRRMLGRIDNSVKRMSELIDALLKLSTLGRIDLVRQRVDLSRIAAEVAQELQAEAGYRRVDVRIAPGLIVDADAALMRAVLVNLLSNAFKFTAAAEHPVVEFGMVESEDGARLFVRDNGAGFDMRYADRLFRPFQRLHPENEFAGLGIGLATVQRIVERHRGRIWAEASPGAGAVFWFELGPVETRAAA